MRRRAQESCHEARAAVVAVDAGVRVPRERESAADMIRASYVKRRAQAAAKSDVDARLLRGARAAGAARHVTFVDKMRVDRSLYLRCRSCRRDTRSAVVTLRRYHRC